MRPAKPAAAVQPDMFRETLEARSSTQSTLCWSWVGGSIGRSWMRPVARPSSTRPADRGLPTRLMAGLHILKHVKGLSDEAVCAAWVENPYFQAFCGERFFQHELSLDRSSMTRWRKRIGAERR